MTTLPWKLRLSYGIGHVFNDICASMWFTYLLVYFHLVLGFDTVSSGAILFIGQIADALSTPFIGYQSDKDDGFWLCKYGKRKTWHLLGTLCVLLSFPFIFTPCIGCGNAHVQAQMVYYGAFVVIFQFGWAAVQISHLALIPELTSCEHERTQLTAVRYSFTVISNILVYVVTWISLKLGEDTDSNNQLGPNDSINFQRVVYIGLVLGALTSIGFHFGVKERPLLQGAVSRRRHKSARDYLSDRKLYQVAIVYMATRIFVNLGQVYVPLYLHETLSKGAESLAIIPLLMYVSSLLASGAVHHINKVFGRMVAYIFGAILGICACIWIKFGGGDRYTEYEIYAVAVLLGFGGSVLLVTSLGITADLIGNDTDTGAFVYGSMSFADKLGNGIAVMLIQYFHCTKYRGYYQNVLSYVCGGSAVVGVLSLLTIRTFYKKLAIAKDETTPILSHSNERKSDEC
ncbi:UNVERIFIED_CONTAM: hypothetical protein PYX00_008709 [Menopon gallinae]|uniref:Major facilitator superfamily domain-containing protein 12-like n=1 Tax=Menopon gallinae TaxID=328185 RepID=A0AAW2HPK2_9NEOP